MTTILRVAAKLAPKKLHWIRQVSPPEEHEWSNGKVMVTYEVKHISHTDIGTYEVKTWTFLNKGEPLVENPDATTFMSFLEPGRKKPWSITTHGELTNRPKEAKSVEEGKLRCEKHYAKATAVVEQPTPEAIAKKLTTPQREVLLEFEEWMSTNLMGGFSALRSRLTRVFTSLEKLGLIEGSQVTPLGKEVIELIK